MKPGGVLGVEVRQEHDIDLSGRDAGLRQPLGDPRPAVEQEDLVTGLDQRRGPKALARGSLTTGAEQRYPDPVEGSGRGRKRCSEQTGEEQPTGVRHRGDLAWIIHEGLGMIARRFARQVGLDRRSQ